MFQLVFWVTEVALAHYLWNKKCRQKLTREQRDSRASGCLGMLLIPIAFLVIWVVCKIYGV